MIEKIVLLPSGLIAIRAWRMRPEDWKAFRAAVGISRDNLAPILGVVPNTLARWERGDAMVGSGKACYLVAVEDLRQHCPGFDAQTLLAAA